MCCNRSHKSRRHTQSIYKSFSRTILGVLQPLLVGYKKPVHFHIIQLISKFIQNFQNIMNHLRLLLFFFVLLAPLQLTSAERDKACYKDCIKETEGIKGGWGCANEKTRKRRDSCRRKTIVGCGKDCEKDEIERVRKIRQG